MRRIFKRRRVLWIVAASALVTAGVTALLLNIVTRKSEERVPFVSVVELTEETDDPAIWGRNFPHQYDAYRRTVDQVRTRYGGSEAQPRTPTAADPRDHVAQSRLAEDPRLKTIWAGYAFAKDFREERGHAYMLEDQLYTERQHVVKQPGACVNCHASTHVAMRRLGNGDVSAGFAKLNAMPYAEARSHVTHPVSCIDCHDPKSMQLRVTRPAFIAGIREVKRLEGVKDYDVNRMATHQERRTFVCAQCHVEYHFSGPGKQLTYPWSNGLQADQILAWYDERKFSDWTHAVTGAPVLKAQHPEFEMWSQGIHARSGVSCTDCHMPYQRVGATKITDHHVRSPVLNLNRACQTCHRWPETELKARVESIQSKTQALRGTAADALVELIGDFKGVPSGKDVPAWVTRAREHHRRAQFLFDFVEAENSSGFHAPQEAARLLGESIDASRRGQLELRDKLSAGRP